MPMPWRHRLFLPLLVQERSWSQHIHERWSICHSFPCDHSTSRHHFGVGQVWRISLCSNQLCKCTSSVWVCGWACHLGMFQLPSVEPFLQLSVYPSRATWRHSPDTRIGPHNSRAYSVWVLQYKHSFQIQQEWMTITDSRQEHFGNSGDFGSPYIPFNELTSRQFFYFFLQQVKWVHFPIICS